MPKWSILLLLVLFLVPSMAQSQESFEDQALSVDLLTGLYGRGKSVETITVPESFPVQIDLANSGRYDVFVEVAHDPTGWILLQWLSDQEELFKFEELRIQWDILQKCADEALNLARVSTVWRLLDEFGLESKRVFVRSRPADHPYIKVYVEQAPWVKPVDANRQGIAQLKRDYSIMSGELDGLKADNDSTNWRRQFNVGVLAYGNGRIDLDTIALKIGVTFKKEYRRWDLSLGGASGGDDYLGDMAKITIDGRHSWMFHRGQPDSTALAEGDSLDEERNDDEDKSTEGTVFGVHLGGFGASQFYPDVNEYNKLAYGLLLGPTCQISDHFTVFLSWAPAFSDKRKNESVISFDSGLLTAQVEF